MNGPDQPGAFQFAQWLGGLSVLACGWLWREISGKASKNELADAVLALKEQNAAMLERVDEQYEDANRARDRLYEKFDEMNRTLGATMVSLSHLQGQLERDTQERNRS